MHSKKIEKWLYWGDAQSWETIFSDTLTFWKEKYGIFKYALETSRVYFSSNCWPMMDSFEVANDFFYAFCQSKQRVQSTAKRPKNHSIEVALKVGKTWFRILSLFERKNMEFSSMRSGQVVLTCLQNAALWLIRLRMLIVFSTLFINQKNEFKTLRIIWKIITSR